MRHVSFLSGWRLLLNLLTIGWACLRVALLQDGGFIFCVELSEEGRHLFYFIDDLKVFLVKFQSLQVFVWVNFSVSCVFPNCRGQQQHEHYYLSPAVRLTRYLPCTRPVTCAGPGCDHGVAADGGIDVISHAALCRVSLSVVWRYSRAKFV